MGPQDSKKKALTDPSYGPSDFRTQLIEGSLRWLATVLASAALGILMYLLLDKQEPVIRFPIHLRGKAALWTLGSVFLIWAILAILNWRSWHKRKS